MTLKPWTKPEGEAENSNGHTQPVSNSSTGTEKQAAQKCPDARQASPEEGGVHQYAAATKGEAERRRWAFLGSLLPADEGSLAFLAYILFFGPLDEPCLQGREI